MNQPVGKFHINPFATRFVEPGCLEWCGIDDCELDELVQRFALLGRRAQIVGPHGSGKTTLLHHLADRFENFSEVQWLTLRRGNNTLPKLKRRLNEVGNDGLLILDGFEQLNFYWRIWVRYITKHRGCGLLITCHHGAGLPTLKRTVVSTEVAARIVAQALTGATEKNSFPGLISELDLEDLLHQHRGNMRECLMELYDLVELRSAEFNGHGLNEGMDKISEGMDKG